MAYVKVKRRELTFAERLYLPSILKGMAHTLKHFVGAGGRDGVTMQYPEEKWKLPSFYRGVPSLVKDTDGREKCVACSLPKEIEGVVEKAPEVFDIDMLRCIFCGYCEEVCPEEAIFMSKEYEVCGETREELVFGKTKLYEIGSTLGPDGGVANAEKKWEKLATEQVEQGLGEDQETAG